MRPGHALVGMRFWTDDRQGGHQFHYEIESYDEAEDKLTITRFWAKGAKIKYERQSAFSYKMDPFSFQTAYDMGDWQLVDDTGTECPDCGENPTDEDDYICKWCRWDNHWKNMLAYVGAEGG